jgi:tetratricopeptide (TPR) repeat protein
MVRSLGALVVSLFAAGLVHGQSSVVPNTDYNFDRSNSALRQQLNNVEQHHLGQGIARIRTRDWSAAYADLDFILGYFPNHPKALELLSDVCLGWKSRKCDFSSYAERAVAVNPKTASTYVVIGIHAMREKRFDDAVNSFKQAIALHPDSLNAHYNLGLTYLNKKDYQRANEHAQRAYELGAPVPGLQRKLIEAGQWKPIEKPKAATAGDQSPENAPNGETSK